jgi:predicted transcriptional regulator
MTVAEQSSKGMLNVKQVLLITDKSQIGNEILAYLVDHPKAQDTLEGIVEWWLLERAIKFQEAQVKKALAELVTKGLVIEQRGNNSKIHYRVNHSKFEEIKKLIEQMAG